MNTIKEIAQLLLLRRKTLGIEQADMYMRIGMKQQQYQRIEAGSDIKLSTLLRVLEGLDLELAITPKLSPEQSNPQMSLPKKSLPTDLLDDSDDLDFWFNSEDK